MDSEPSLIGSDEIAGQPLLSPSGERVGHLTGCAIDKITGRVAHVSVAFDGYLALASKTFTVPWSALRGVPGGVMLSDVDLRAARDQAVSNDPLGDPEWEAHVKNYFSREAFDHEAVDRATHEMRPDRSDPLAS